ncbi:hypothetical protein E2C01_099763 [Portunus trituberculatus]|uniref:Uncharacterized protein n=1 Tax=Portunus trituberculatus TaxID=210409 RepID=A0A5B7K6C5_PORTR|nr:hypothetical protein [Portunus trituberculatus]
MMGAHRRPPNHTGDHGHQQTNGTRQNVSLLRAATPRVDERTTGNVAPNRLHFPQDNKPVVLPSHGLPNNKPATQRRAQLPDR